MLKMINENTVVIDSRVMISHGLEGKRAAIKRVLLGLGFEIISSGSSIVAKIPEKWSIFCYADDSHVEIRDQNDITRITDATDMVTLFVKRYEVYYDLEDGYYTVYMADHMKKKRKKFSSHPYLDTKAYSAAEKLMKQRYPKMQDPLAYWR